MDNPPVADLCSKADDIDSTTLAVVNVMPRAELYEAYIRKLVPPNTNLLMLRMKNHVYSSSDLGKLASSHSLCHDCDFASVDGLLISGSPLDRMVAFENATYWRELTSVLLHASSYVGSIAGICWGALAIAKIFLGIEKKLLGRKLFGVYRSSVTYQSHPYMMSVGRYLELPHSRHAEIDPIAIRKLAREGVLAPLDWSNIAGYSCIASSDFRLFMIQAHIDYPLNRLAQEYYWSQDKQASSQFPENYNIHCPLGVWLETSRSIFANWLTYSKRLKSDHLLG